MPSGSHGGGGGHFSGGGSHSSGGGHFGGRSTSSSSSIRSGPRIVVFNGRRVYFSSARASAQSIFVVLFVLGLIFSAIFGSLSSTNKEQLATIRQDYNFYQSMIADAEKNPTELIITATVKSYKRLNNTDYFCVFYSFVADNGLTNKGHTFYVYNRTQMQNLLNDGEFEIAVNQRPTTEFTDSIPIDYKNTTLTDDGEYIQLKGKSNGYNVGLTISIILTVGFFVGVFVVVGTARKATEQEIKELGENSAPLSKVETNLNQWTCAYCGSINSNQETTCPKCGANKKKPS